MATLESITERWEASKGQGIGKYAGKEKEIPLNKIEVDPEVFQPRFVAKDTDGIQNKDHVYSLKKRIETEGSIDPLLVLPVGDTAIVIDGHHRLAAYKKAKIKKVKVLIYSGDPNAAKLESAKENHKLRLQMSKQEQSQSAWNFVKQGIESLKPLKWFFTENQIIQATAISGKQIKIMRQVYRDFVAKGEEVPDSWLTVLRGAQDDANRDWDAEMEKQIEAYRAVLLKHFPKLTTSRKREAFALAVVSFSPQSTQEILRYMIGSDDGKQALEAMGEDFQEIKGYGF